jgi:hypothetical protein
MILDALSSSKHSRGNHHAKKSQADSSSQNQIKRDDAWCVAWDNGLTQSPQGHNDGKCQLSSDRRCIGICHCGDKKQEQQSQKWKNYSITC